MLSGSWVSGMTSAPLNGKSGISRGRSSNFGVNRVCAIDAGFAVGYAEYAIDARPIQPRGSEYPGLEPRGHGHAQFLERTEPLLAKLAGHHQRLLHRAPLQAGDDPLHARSRARAVKAALDEQ